MKNESYSTSIEVAATPAEVFKHISNVSQWWIRDFQGKSAHVDDEFSVNIPGQHYSKQKLVEVVPDKRVVWLVTDSKLDWIPNNKHEWTNTKMIFEIAPKGDKTVLHFMHDGLVPTEECYSNCVRGWNMVITDMLYRYIAEGGTTSVAYEKK